MTARSSLYSSSMMPPSPPPSTTTTFSSFGWSDFPIPSEYHCGEKSFLEQEDGHDHQEDDCCPYLDEKDFQDTSSSTSLASHLLLSCSPDSVTMIDYDLSWQRQQEWMRNKAREEQQQQQSCRCPPPHIATRVSFDTNVHIRTFPVVIVTTGTTNSVELGWEYQDDEIEVTMMVDDDCRRRRRPLRKWTFEERREILKQQQQQQQQQRVE